MYCGVASDRVYCGVASDRVYCGVASDRVYCGVASDRVYCGVASDRVYCGVAGDSVCHVLQVNGTLPDRIVVFRDGVGDGQMNTVKQYEVPQFLASFSRFQSNYQPKLAVVVVQKRISTRIFSRGGPKGVGNPSPGTIVDHTITRKGW